MLNANQKIEFTKREPSALLDALSKLPPYWENGIWLDSNNRYKVRCIKNLTSDFRPGFRVTHKHLREYIAASTIVHGFDGWSYLGRAVNALLVGDHDCARHLGYYAELRAGMAILASEGVGVFSYEHAVISARGKCLQMPPYRKPSAPDRPRGIGTHVFVWEALEELMTSTASGSLLLEVSSAGGSTLSEWLGHFASVPALSTQLAADWLRAWGLDIARLAHDRNARNISSYRPTSFTTPRPPDVKTVVDFVCRLWTICEPTNENPFAVIDRLLLRATLQNGFRAAYSNTAKHAKRQFRLRIESVLTGLQPSIVPGLDWISYLADFGTHNLDVLVQARGTIGPEQDSGHSIQVISRAFLLLRVASGTAQRLLRRLPVDDATRLRLWISEVGIDRALWPLGDEPTSLSDLWSDSSDAIEELRLNLGSIDSYNDLWKKFPFAARMLSSYERVGLWGLGL